MLSKAFTLPRYCLGTTSMSTLRMRGRVLLASAVRRRCTVSMAGALAVEMKAMLLSRPTSKSLVQMDT